MHAHSPYFRIAATLNVLLLGALVADHFANNGAAFLIIAGLFIAHVVSHVTILVASSPGRPNRDGPPVVDVPRVADVRPVSKRDRSEAAKARVASAPSPRPKPKYDFDAGPVAEGVSTARCDAIRMDDTQCTYDARPGSPHCGAHQGYRPTHAPRPSGKPTKATRPAPKLEPKPVAVVEAVPRVIARKKPKAAAKPTPRQAAKPAKVATKPASKPPAKAVKPSGGRCQAVTAKKTPCSNNAKGAGKFCGIHSKKRVLQKA